MENIPAQPYFKERMGPGSPSRRASLPLWGLDFDVEKAELNPSSPARRGGLSHELLISTWKKRN